MNYSKLLPSIKEILPLISLKRTSAARLRPARHYLILIKPITCILIKKTSAAMMTARRGLGFIKDVTSKVIKKTSSALTAEAFLMRLEVTVPGWGPASRPAPSKGTIQARLDGYLYGNQQTRRF